MIYIFTLLLMWFLNDLWKPTSVKGDVTTGITLSKRRKKYCITIGIWLFLLLILRHAYVGTDTQNYFKVFNDIKYLGFSLEFADSELKTEYGFYFLNHLLIKAGLPFRVLLAISAGFYIYTIGYLIYRYSQRPAISFFIFLTFGYFIFNTTMRQCFALSFCIWATIFIINGKWKLSLLFCLFAALFHSTAIVFFSIIIVPFLRYNWKSFFLILGVGVFIFTSSTAIYGMASEMMGKNYEVQEATGYFSLLIYIGIVIVGLIVRKHIPDVNRFWFFLIVISIIVFPLASLNPALFRIRLYFSVFIIVYVANISLPKCATTIPLLLVIYSYGLYSFFIGTSYSGVRVLPYVFYWENYYELNPKASTLGLYPAD